MSLLFKSVSAQDDNKNDPVVRASNFISVMCRQYKHKNDLAKATKEFLQRNGIPFTDADIDAAFRKADYFVKKYCVDVLPIAKKNI